MSLTDTTAFATEDPVCFLATTDADPPDVRGWLFWFAHDTGFYFQTLAPKDVYHPSELDQLEPWNRMSTTQERTAKRGPARCVPAT